MRDKEITQAYRKDEGLGLGECWSDVLQHYQGSRKSGEGNFGQVFKA